MKFFKVTDLDDAKDIVKDNIIIAGNGFEKISLLDSLQRRMGEDIFSTEMLPEYARSTVDGYAVRAVNTYGATDSIPTMLKVIGKVEMGVVGAFEVQSGEAVYVPTGGELPKGADSMVMVEYAQSFTENLVAIYKPTKVGENVISKGDDISIGDKIATKGEIITPQILGLLAGVGISKIKVYKPLKVAIISTGDEIVEIEKKEHIGQIRDTNTTLNSTLCQKEGLEVTFTKLVVDNFEILDEAVKAACKVADIVLVSGGSSIGARDYTEKVFEKQGQILVHGLSLKPGKPTIVAKANGKLLIGLPGHPMACLLTLKLLLLDSIAEMYGDNEANFIYAKTSINFPSSPGRLTVQPVRINHVDGEIIATPLFYKSGLVSILSKANGYILIPAHVEGILKGANVKVHLL